MNEQVIYELANTIARQQALWHIEQAMKLAIREMANGEDGILPWEWHRFETQVSLLYFNFAFPCSLNPNMFAEKSENDTPENRAELLREIRKDEIRERFFGHCTKSIEDAVERMADLEEKLNEEVYKPWMKDREFLQKVHNAKNGEGF
jgi:hypothetical protein